MQQPDSRPIYRFGRTEEEEEEEDSKPLEMITTLSAGIKNS